MSTIINGEYVRSDLTKDARGGTEMMVDRLLRTVDKESLEAVQIHVSRPSRNKFDENKKQIMWCHDLALDPENRILENGGWQKFAKFVFVSHWQRDQYILVYKIPYSKCTVIENAIETEFVQRQKPTDQIRFIYHTTPHRGLELVYPVFEQLARDYSNIHLDVYSSFKIYGWEQRDAPYQQLFDNLKNHPQITYHGTKSNDEVLEALKNSHIFMYPCIWQETSCIAMIEAIRSGCMVIHPSYAALPETANGATVMYDYHENPSTHASICYQLTKHILEVQKNHPNFINTFIADPSMSLRQNSISAFASKWNTVLEKIKYE